MLLALSATQKTGLAVVAGCFIAFALLSSFVFSRYRPDFPGGRGLRWFIVCVLVLTAGMLSAVVFLAAETEGASEAAQKKNAVGNRPAVTPSGDAAAGKALFTSSGCATCHTFTAAGSSATIGPNLDHLAADAQKANRGSVEEYATESIENPSAYVAPGFPPGVMPANFAQTLSKAQIADLVAFLTQTQ